MVSWRDSPRGAIVGSLVWYEVHGDLESARVREFRMKAWKRAWKVREIEGFNPDWEDLYDRIAQP